MQHEDYSCSSTPQVCPNMLASQINGHWFLDFKNHLTVILIALCLLSETIYNVWFNSFQCLSWGIILRLRTFWKEYSWKLLYSVFSIPKNLRHTDDPLTYVWCIYHVFLLHIFIEPFGVPWIITYMALFQSQQTFRHFKYRYRLFSHNFFVFCREWICVSQLSTYQSVRVSSCASDLSREIRPRLNKTSKLYTHWRMSSMTCSIVR